MKWESIKQNIKKQCKLHKKNPEYTKQYLKYAKRLYDNGVPIISSPKHFSLLVGMEHQYVCSMAYAADKFYRHFTIPKKSGGDREIYEPLPDLKFVQTWILENILEKCPVSEYAKAYVKGKTLKHNARFHKAKKVVVTMDIKNFFPSITIEQVTKIFEEIGYSNDLSCFLAYLCCLKSSLPQGASTSPYLSNLRMLNFDSCVGEYAVAQGICYTRYADDLTFSGDFDAHKLIKEISDLVYTEGFSVNPKKTRVARQNARQEVTGIVVNAKMQVSKKNRKAIRQQVYYIQTYGLDSHLDHIHETRAGYLNHLLGKINFALFVNPKDEEMKEYFNFILGTIKSYED